jgi:pimeloyl-ACP methyl ester carboxylesterase
MYAPKRFSTLEHIQVRSLRIGVRRWGCADAPRLFFLHGWMDSSPTFQFLVDALQGAWQVIAPDWRGYGASQWLSHPYWFPDYYADLHAILAHYSDEPVCLVGHSMGGNIASIYAGLRPERVSRLVMMDFLGLPVPTDADGSRPLGHWLDEVFKTPTLRTYPSHEALAQRLMAANPRLTPARAGFLSRAVSCTTEDGLVSMACDPWHRVPAPTLYRVEDAMASWQRVTAPVLMLLADEGYVQQRFASQPDEFQRRLRCFQHHQMLTITDASHNLQHDQPEQVAAALENFLQT